MEIEYQNSKDDFVEFNKLYHRRRLIKSLGVIVPLIIFLTLAFSGTSFKWSYFLIAMIASTVVIFGSYYFIPLMISSIRLNSTISKDKSRLDKKKLTIDDDGLLIESENKTMKWTWENIVSVQSNDKFIYVFLANKRSLFFAKRHFPSDDEVINFIKLIQNKIIISRGISASSLEQGNKPSYLLGLLCLIPIIGAFVGLGLLLYGIFNYKDKWLIVIGAGGILFTVSIYATMFYNFQYGTDTRVGFSNLSQVEINRLMKSVEFYKLEYGVYPDSLGQIRNNDHTAEIDDPLQLLKSGNSKLTTRFNYQKVGNHYYLFSSGIDGIPNTKDDIYPQVAKSDSAKFGLIRRSY